jgi:penicillin-binding protein 1A
MVLIDPHSGKVVALVGGYSYSRSQFNRVTQSLRQPGSTFKPVLYLAAVDGYKYTPSTIVHDGPRTFRVGDEYWTPANFDEKFLGAITLRVALEKSRNLVSADIVSRIGIDAVIQYAKRLGISSKLGRNLSLSLGSSEVTLLELTRAYGVFAAKGVLFDSVFITRVVDRTGRVIFDAETESLARAQQAIDPNSAFVMAHMMKGVVEFGTGYKIKEIMRPVAGKTGTSNDQMDTWFIGYTPQWAAGVWVGFDTKKEIGEKETGGKVAAPIWLYGMRDFLNYQDQRNYAQLVEEAKNEASRLGVEYVAPEPLTPLDFSPPEGVDPYWVNHDSGIRMEEGHAGAFLEYFVRGTEPPRGGGEPDTSSYLESPDL